MAKSKIEWTDETWNPVTGCTKVSAGCKNCYAERMYERFNGKGTFKNITLHTDRLEQPLRWKRPRMCFVCSMSDLFHKDVPFEFIDKVFAVMALCPQHTFQVLTKRPERMADYIARLAKSIDPLESAARSMGHSLVYEGLSLLSWPIPNVWLGTSVEDQAAAEERIPHLLKCPAAVRFLSLEPLLGPVDLKKAARLTWECTDGPRSYHAMRHPDESSRGGDINCAHDKRPGCNSVLHWLIIGGESGPGARPCNIEWVRSLVKQGQDAGVPVFVKQLGARAVGPTGHPMGEVSTGAARLTTKHSKGGDPDEWPEDLRVREMPKTGHTEPV